MQNTVGQQNIPIQQYNTQGAAPQYQSAPQQYQTAPQQAQPPVPQPTSQPAALDTQQQYVQQPISQPAPQNQNVQVPNYSGVNIQIFNPSVATPGSTAPVYNVNAPNYGSTNASGCYPPQYYTQQLAPQQPTAETKPAEKKTEKREIVQLTDDYIKNLENYLNSQDQEVRLMGAKEVMARLDEDHSRKDDKALNALVNKMLQDPSSAVRILALSALDSRIVTGDDFTVGVLQQMQNSQSGYGQDALQASNVLLKMSGQTTEKEFEVKNNTQKTENKGK